MSLLSSQKTEASFDLSKQVILIHGKPKIGKSTLCSKLFPNGLFIASEPGLNFLNVYKVNVTNWQTFLDVCAEIAQGKHQFSPIIIDTIDCLAIYCTEFICTREKINHPSDYEYGKGWGMVTKELQRVLSKLSAMGFGLVMVGHTKTEEIKTKVKSYNKDSLSITGENKRVILSMADLILYIDQEIDNEGGEKRIIRTKPSIYWDAGDRSKLLPPVLPLDAEVLSKYFKTKEE